MIINSVLNLSGEFFEDSLHRVMYSTDASAYRELPMAVAFPVDGADVNSEPIAN